MINAGSPSRNAPNTMNTAIVINRNSAELPDSFMIKLASNPGTLSAAKIQERRDAVPTKKSIMPVREAVFTIIGMRSRGLIYR